MDAHDVLVGDLAREQQLALEAPFEILGLTWIAALIGLQDDLQRHGHAELLVPRLVDRTHAAGAEQTDDVVAAGDESAAREGRGQPPRRTGRAESRSRIVGGHRHGHVGVLRGGREGRGQGIGRRGSRERSSAG